MGFRLPNVCVLGVVCLLACDWQQFALLNSIPIESNLRSSEPFHVFIGVDGLPFEIAHKVLSDTEGNETAQKISIARAISMFPATSDASWTRILHTSSMYSYEYEYYNPQLQKIVNKGYLGLLKHTLPPFRDSILEQPLYYQAFDYYRSGYLDGLWAYRAIPMSLSDGLDEFSFILEGRLKNQDSFFAYFLEFDALGHIEDANSVEIAFRQLWLKTRDIKKRHPERDIVFTIMSDHGMDFIAADTDQLVDFSDELEKLHLRPVDFLGNQANAQEVVPIIHTRVSYVALHTHLEYAAEIAQKCSESTTTDLVIAKILDPWNWLSSSAIELDGDEQWRWYGIWQAGELLVAFAYSQEHDVYRFVGGLDFAQQLGLELRCAVEQSSVCIFDDEQLFHAAVSSSYPDLFYRVRTSLEPIGIKYPAQVLVSFRRPYASLGFKIPGGANEIATSAFHGGLDAGSSTGVLISENHDLPEAIRADNILEWIPEMRQHLLRKRVQLQNMDANAFLEHPIDVHSD